MLVMKYTSEGTAFAGLAGAKPSMKQVMPIARGQASTSARNARLKVPASMGRMPNSPMKGFHTELKIPARPLTFESRGQEKYTRNPKTAVTHRAQKSMETKSARSTHFSSMPVTRLPGCLAL